MRSLSWFRRCFSFGDGITEWSGFCLTPAQPQRGLVGGWCPVILFMLSSQTPAGLTAHSSGAAVVSHCPSPHVCWVSASTTGLHTSHPLFKITLQGPGGITLPNLHQSLHIYKFGSLDTQ